jgi:hypothetical protein
MVFYPAKESGQLAPIPDNISISEFMLNEKHGRRAHATSRDPYTCGFTGKSYSSQETANRVDLLARGLSKELGWAPNQGSEWDKTLAVFTLNTVSDISFPVGMNEKKYKNLSVRLLIRSILCPYSGLSTDWAVSSPPPMHLTRPTN